MKNAAMSKNEGVSPVIGTILIVALTVVLVGIVGAVLMGFGMPEPAPILGVGIGQQGNVITVTHLNGDVLPAGTYTILVDGVDKTADFGGTVEFGPGITLSWDSGTEAVGTVSLVYTSDTGVSTLIAEKKIGKAGSGGSSDLSVFVVEGQSFTFNTFSEGIYAGQPRFQGQWNDLKENVTTDIYPGPRNGQTFYEENIEERGYWYVYEDDWMSDVDAANPDYTISDFNAYIKSFPGHNFDVIIKIDTSRLLTSDDTSGIGAQSVTFPETYPRGTLYKNENGLYLYAGVTDSNQFYLGGYDCPLIGNIV